MIRTAGPPGNACATYTFPHSFFDENSERPPPRHCVTRNLLPPSAPRQDLQKAPLEASLAREPDRAASGVRNCRGHRT